MRSRWPLSQSDCYFVGQRRNTRDAHEHKRGHMKTQNSVMRMISEEASEKTKPVQILNLDV